MGTVQSATLLACVLFVIGYPTAICARVEISAARDKTVRDTISVSRNR